MSESLSDVDLSKLPGYIAAAPVYVPFLIFGFLMAIMGIFIPTR